MTANTSLNHHSLDEVRAQELENRLIKLTDRGTSAIVERLRELAREWSAGRAIKVTLAFVILLGSGLATTLGWFWVLLPVISGALLMQYLFAPTSPITGLFQQMGYRSGSEIEHEKIALMALRGDFHNLPTVHDIEPQEDILRLEGEGGIVVEAIHAKADPKEAVKEVIEATNV